MLFSAVAAMAQMPDMPVDKDVRIGKLDNGLTYYIRHNNYPEHVANFYIAQKVGSINENDDQRGLAHFLEHMAFNGSEHFKGNGIIEYTRSLGVEFGRDLNAFTSLDQTVYNIDNVPTTRKTAVDSCLLILKDWSNGLLLEPAEIDKERGVVHGEWRLGSGPQQRIQDAIFPEIHKGSKYGNRLPIGLMSIIDSFQPKTLRAYYEKWYRPDNQGIIVVGDVDVDQVENTIKTLWKDVKVAPDAEKIPFEVVPDNNEAIYALGKDKEMQMDQFLIMMKQDIVPDEMKSNVAYLIQKYGVDVMCDMLNTRFQDVAQTEGAAFTAAQCFYGNYMSAKTKDALITVVIPKEGQNYEAIQQVMVELLRAQKFGFVESEYQRARDEYLSKQEKIYDNRDKTKTDVYAQGYIANFINNEPIPSIEDKYQLVKQLVPLMPVDLVNELAKEYIADTDTNLVIAGFMRDKEGVQIPDAAGMAQAVNAARMEKIEAYADEVSNEPLLAQLPKKGSIKKITENKALGYKELILSNGVKVNLKKTDFKNDEVVLQAYAEGGTSLYGDADIDNIKIISMGFMATGKGQFSGNQLDKMLSGKQAEVDLSIGATEQNLTGHSTPKDLETLMQLIYLQFTATSADKPAYDQQIGMVEQIFSNAKLNPQLVFADSMSVTVNSHNPRAKLPEASTFKNANYDRMLKIVQERLANAAEYTFTFVGNFDEEVMKGYVEQYIASLPTNKKLSGFKDIRTDWTGHVENRFKAKMQDAQSMVAEVWRSNGVNYTLENAVLLKAAGDLLQNVYLRTIREESSASYTVSAKADVDADGNEIRFSLAGICPCDPAKVEQVEKLLKDGVNEAAEKVDPEVLNKVKEAMLNQYDVNSRTNNFWLGKIYMLNKFGVDGYTDYKKTVQAITPEKLSAFIKNTFIASGHHAEIVMNPEPADK